MAFTDVPPPTRPTLNVVFGLRRDFERVDLRDRAAHRLNRVGHAERAIAVAARSLERHLVPIAAHADVGDAQARAVHRDELIDLSLETLVEQLLHAAQVAEALLADVRDKGDRARRLDVGLVQRADHAEHHGQPAAIVADAGPFQDVAVARDFDVRAFGEDGVEVRARRPDCGRAALPGRTPITLPARSMRTSFSPSSSNRRFSSLPRASS